MGSLVEEPIDPARVGLARDRLAQLTWSAGALSGEPTTDTRRPPRFRSEPGPPLPVEHPAWSPLPRRGVRWRSVQEPDRVLAVVAQILAKLIRNPNPKATTYPSIPLVNRRQMLSPDLFPHARNPPRGLPGQMSRRYASGLHFGWRDTRDTNSAACVVRWGHSRFKSKF